MVEDTQVSIHAPAWGATLKSFPIWERGLFQSTLPHGERQKQFNDVANRTLVSIHAPAWGATFDWS